MGPARSLCIDCGAWCDLFAQANNRPLRCCGYNRRFQLVSIRLRIAADPGSDTQKDIFAADSPIIWPLQLWALSFPLSANCAFRTLEAPSVGFLRALLPAPESRCRGCLL